MDFRNNSSAQNSRGLRNNNPLNLRPVGFTYLGQVGVDAKGHAIFTDIVYGVRAATLELYTNYFVHGLKTFAELVHDIAPASDGNNEAAYVSSLKNATGLGSSDIRLSGNNIEKVLKAFFSVELGGKYANMIASSDIVKGINAANKKALEVGAGAAGGGFVLLVAIVLGLAYGVKKNR